MLSFVARLFWHYFQDFMYSVYPEMWINEPKPRGKNIFQTWLDDPTTELYKRKEEEEDT